MKRHNFLWVPNSGGSVEIPVGLKQLVNGGRLFVPPARYVDCDAGGDDLAVSLDSTDAKACFSWIQEADMALSKLALFVTAIATQGNITGDLYLASSDMKPTGSSILDLGTVNSGSSADSWVTFSFTAEQLTRGKSYAVVFGVESGVDISISGRRQIGTPGTAIPDNIKSFTSSDGGSSYSELMQDTYEPAALNLILNPAIPASGNPVPQLWFGSIKEGGIFIPGSSDLVTIPEEGVPLDCSGLTANTLHYVYAYDSSGLALEASITEAIYSSGLMVKSGETNKRRIGCIYPRTIIGSYQGPCDTPDQREIINECNRRQKSLFKQPFAAASLVAASNVPTEWANGAYRINILSSGDNEFWVEAVATLSTNSGDGIYLTFGIDGATRHEKASMQGQDWLGASGNDDRTGQDTKLGPLTLPEGQHDIRPLETKTNSGDVGTLCYYYPDRSFVSLLRGEIAC